MASQLSQQSAGVLANYFSINVRDSHLVFFLHFEFQDHCSSLGSSKSSLRIALTLLVVMHDQGCTLHLEVILAIFVLLLQRGHQHKYLENLH